LRRGQVNVGDVEELSAAALEALDAIVAATPKRRRHAGRIHGGGRGTESGIRAPARAHHAVRAWPAKTAPREADDVATRAVQAAQGLTDLERATRDLEQGRRCCAT